MQLLVIDKIAVSLDFPFAITEASTKFDRANMTLNSVFESFNLGEIILRENQIGNEINLKRLKSALALYESVISAYCFHAIQHI
jgi:hypothetical protein